MNLDLSLMTIFLMIGFCQAQTDRTLESEAAGKDVAEAAYDKVKKVFDDDHRFLIRIAFVESQFGKSPQTFRKNYHGGIWQVDKIGFIDTQNVDSHTNLKLKYRQIKDEFGIDWTTVTWEDLKKPLYSALAARLLLLNNNQPIPTSVEHQGDYWKKYYNSDEGKGTKEKFINDVKALESCKTSKSKCRLDLVIVLDGSGSIGSSDFSRARKFVVDLVKCISSRYTHIGFIVYSTTYKIIFHLNNNLNETELESKILSVNYPAGGTGTAQAIDAAVQLFSIQNSEPGNSTTEPSSTPFPKLMIVLTDGQSDSPESTSHAAVRATTSGIISYAIGIGSGYNLLELGKIAGSNENQVFTISSYSHLTDLLYQTRTQTCSKPVRPRRQTVVEDFVHQFEISYYAFNIPREGITFSLNVTEGDTLGYYSYTIENPTAALNDGTIGKGSNYIPSPPKANDSGKTRIRRMATDINTTSTQVPELDVQYGQVYIAIEGVEPMNNFTIFVVDGGSPAGANSIRTTSVNVLIITLGFWILIQCFKCN